MKLSLLLTARKDSKFMAKFIMTYLVHTRYLEEVELLIMTPRGDWNEELFQFLQAYTSITGLPRITLIDDDTELGRGGSHVFYKTMGELAIGEWLWYMCDDHYLVDGYDAYIFDYIKENNIASDKINVIVPQAINSGRISHILSRKYFNSVGVANHGNVDSYINETLEYLEVFIGADEVKKLEHFPPEPIIKDFSLEKDIMLPIHAPAFDPVKEAELFKSEVTKEKIHEDARILFEAVKGEHV